MIVKNKLFNIILSGLRKEPDWRLEAVFTFFIIFAGWTALYFVANGDTKATIAWPTAMIVFGVFRIIAIINHDLLFRVICCCINFVISLLLAQSIYKFLPGSFIGFSAMASFAFGEMITVLKFSTWSITLSKS